MLFHTLALVLFATSPALILSLQCIQCKENIVVNYTVTSETVPSFAHCQYNTSLARQCFIRVTWDQINNTTTLWVDSFYFSSPKASVRGSEDLNAATVLRVSPDRHAPSLEHLLEYDCSSEDRCNNETNLKKILQSLIMKDRFLQEITPILKIISPFDPKSAECFDFNNASLFCDKKDLNNCPHCSSTVTRFNPFDVEVCQTCPSDGYRENIAMRFVGFQFITRKNIFDSVDCSCQLKGCNSIENSNKIYNASQITFDFDKFYNSS